MATKRKRSPSPFECANVRDNDNALTHADYTIAWICALHLELNASRTMLDEVHELLPADGDRNVYVLGRIAKHNVVMVALPGVYGKVNAAAVSTDLKRSFPNIKATLMVGIGGGAPGEADLYLGDVVVGTRVMEYDLGKATNDGFESTAIPKHPSSLLLSAVTNLRSKHGMDQWSPRSQELLQRLPRHPRPAQPDRLFQASYPHLAGEQTCDHCDVSKLQLRPRRLTEDFWIHYGVVASGDSVNKDAHKRDAVSRRLQAKCFEMEAAGIMDSLECLPIRGICDYSDSHKTKAWQDYAAATAASYARELLETIPSLASRQVPSVVRSVVPAVSTPSPSAELLDKRKSFLDLLDFPRINARKDAIRAEQGKTCRWFLTHPKYLDWADLSGHGPHSSSLLWIRGKAGAGKSTLMKFLYSEVKKKRFGVTVVSFFFNARGEHLEKSITGMYRSLLKQILTHLPGLHSILDQVDLSFTSDMVCPDLNALKDILKCVVMALGRQCLICFVDALDECNEDDARDMVQFFEDLTDSATEESIQLRVCFSSRPYPYIQINDEILLTLENETGHTDDLEKYVRKCLKAPKSLQADLQRQILEKASGVFMWVVLVVGILNKETARGGLALHRRLSEIPPTLGQLFKDILTRDQERPDELRRCILWVLCAFRPLTPEEFYHAMWAGGLADGQVDEEMPNAEDDEANMALAASSSKGLVEITNAAKKGSTVQFIHESVRDFLIKERGIQELWPDLGFEWEGPSHENLRACCESYLMHPTILAIIKPPSTDVRADVNNSYNMANLPTNRGFWDVLRTQNIEATPVKMPPFVEYSSQHILEHARRAASSVPQDEFVSRFFSSLGTQVLDLCQSVKSKRYGPTATPLYVLADKGFSNEIRTWLNVQPLASVQCDKVLPFQHPLFAAMANNHKGTLAALLNLPSVILEGENIMEGINRRSDLKHFKGRTPISWAAQEGKLKLVKILAQNGESLHQKDPGRRMPIERAALGGQEAVVRYFCDNNVTAEVKELAITSALEGKQHGLSLTLLKSLDDMGYRTWRAILWLHKAAETGDLEITKLLLDNGIDINFRWIDGRTALSTASMYNSEAIVRYLISRGADPHRKCRKNGMTAYDYALRGGNTVIAIFLRESIN
ncbi:hypothetical protein PG999_003944 [Apiospora kogelbergensis]|uniref:NACHT domain-containing protein n=1 Tax=Apiospora kogelbergensis TaxID=1337665 RepID=A0AAW0R550_9PEZI